MHSPTPPESAKVELRISNENLGFGIAAILHPSDYDEIYRAGDLPRRARRDTQYGLCFRVALWRAMLYLRDRQEDWPLGVVMEDGHRNVGDAIRVYSEISDGMYPAYRGLFGSISFLNKDCCLPLAAADHFAYSLFRFSSGATGDPEQHYMPAGAADPPYIVTIPMARVLITRDGLAQMRDALSGK
jgi:hypothetical protein